MLKLFTTMFLVVATVTAEKPAAALQNKLGVGDVITICAAHATTEFGDGNIEIGENGSIHLAMIGRVQAAGRTPGELTSEIERRLGDFILEPHVLIVASDVGAVLFRSY